MSLIFCDSFDHYDTADLLRKWDAFSGSPSITAGAGRRGTQALALNTTATPQKNIANTASLIVGFAFKLPFFPGGTALISSFFQGGTTQVDLRVDATGHLLVTRNGTALTDGTSTNTLATAVFNFIEWKVTIANSIGAGTCVVKVNGVTWITVATGQDTQNTANAFADQLRFHPTGSTSFTVHIDDLYLCDSAGSVNNDFLGDCRVDCLMPNAAGNYSQFTPSAGSNFQNVDETSPDDDTTHNESSTAGHKDSYQHASLTQLTTSDIKAVQVNVMAKKDDAGARSLKVGMRSGSTDSLDAGTGLSTDYLNFRGIFETDPNTAAQWTETNANAAESLAEVV